MARGASGDAEAWTVKSVAETLTHLATGFKKRLICHGQYLRRTGIVATEAKDSQRGQTVSGHARAAP